MISESQTPISNFSLNSNFPSHSLLELEKNNLINDPFFSYTSYDPSENSTWDFLFSPNQTNQINLLNEEIDPFSNDGILYFADSFDNENMLKPTSSESEIITNNDINNTNEVPFFDQPYHYPLQVNNSTQNFINVDTQDNKMLKEKKRKLEIQSNRVENSFTEILKEKNSIIKRKNNSQEIENPKKNNNN